MRKIQITILILLTIFLTSCTKNLGHTMKDLSLLDSYQIVLDIEYMYNGQEVHLNNLVKVQGSDIYYTDFADYTHYISLINGEEYWYSNESTGSYILSYEPILRIFGINEFLYLMDFEDFKKDSNDTWIYTKEKIILDDWEDVFIDDISITLSEDNFLETLTFTRHNLDSDSDFYMVNDLFTYVVSEYNNTTVTFPF